MGEIRSYRDLKVWQRTFALGLEVCQCAKRFPVDERYALTAQMRRSAISVSSNIAEGYGRGSRNDYLRFLKVARGSLYELDTQLLMARELKYLELRQHGRLEEQLNECGRMLAGLIKRLETKGNN